MNYQSSYYHAKKAKKSKNLLSGLLVIMLTVILASSGYYALQSQTEQQVQAAATEEVNNHTEELEEDITEEEAPDVHFPEIKDKPKPLLKRLNVPIHIQERGLSCEVAALKMALAYKGVNVSEDELMNHVGYDPTPHVGNTWGNPHQAFVGDINGRQPTTGYGVYWEPIARAGGKYRATEYFTNGTVQLLTEEIGKGNSVIIWGNAASGRRVDWYTPNGGKIIAISGEHTIVVKGYNGEKDNPTEIIVNDPHSGEIVYSVSELKKQWSLLGYAGVIVK